MRLAKVYEPGVYEEDIYALWERSGAFAPPKASNKDSYTIAMPPPNANADLHLGYGLTVALEDIIARYQRMRGKAVLLLPGADHAGFETQAVYEKHLSREGKSRFDFTREELYGQIWDFVALNRGNFEKQMRSMGVSADWSRYTFTLDPKIVGRAYETFKKMWDEGLIYRGERLINYCTFHGTGFADVEVAYKETAGHLWHLRYPLTDGSGEVIVATTRPETMLGDVAVAVHPDDKRYQQYIGRTIKLPLTHREVPILADSFVDMNFGTGAVKITPAHDQNDFEVAGRHDLPMITVIGYDGNLNHHAPEGYRGLEVKEARGRIIADLKKQDILASVDDHTSSVGHCYKCGTVIEPLLKEQWFVDMQPLAKPAIAALKAGKIAFYPDGKREQLIRYLEGLRDWNISRQIAWGIPIPAFQNVDNPDEWVFGEQVDKEFIKIGDKTYRRDPDVFDTWFSSSSWPYATLGDADSEDYKQFYPTSLMETGGEILYPWVSRMIMLGLYEAGDIPFSEVYIHGYVMAEDGSKMSKSIGNTVDPMPVIAKYGSDALRMGIVSGRTPAVNRGYDPRRIEEARNFANKLWNVARYIEDSVKENLPGQKPVARTSADHWILSRLSAGTKTISSHLENYRFSEAYETLYHLVWDDVADWYIETSKSGHNASILDYTLETILKLAHPFAPFVTETIWQTLHADSDSLLITSSWPKTARFDKKAAAEFDKIKTIVSEIRQIKTLLHIPKGNLYFSGAPFVLDNADMITRLARLDSVKQVEDGRGLHLTQTDENCWLDIDFETARDFAGKLAERRTAISKQLRTLQSRLDNPSYIKKAPKPLIKESKTRQKDLKIELQTVEKQLQQFDYIYLKT